ncbi:MAG TPA: GTPase HflX [Terriglobales bacterium]|nr:GTPase HflX [Terriglobales bacterium]
MVGIDYRQRSSPDSPDGTERAKAPKLAHARAARAAAEVHQENVGRFGADESLAELYELTLSAGAEIVGEILQRRDKPDPATLIGRGKVEEISGAAAMSNADVVIFDHELSPSQLRNLEREINCRIIDRTQLILDIFARHARTSEGQLQVELAQLKYMLPRLAGRGIEMSQTGGGIGTRGPGETQLETDRRKINRRIRHLEEQLENVRKVRRQQRQRRESVPVATVALVGYTNAGKSTLFNALTKADVYASSKMFATLDPTVRAIVLPSKRKITLSDTVGFIRNLPHTLVSAFRATLEEVQRASLILHVSDATSPNRAEQDAQVELVLKELEAQDKPRLHVFNKLDLVPEDQRAALVNTEDVLFVSAKQGLRLDALLDRIDGELKEDAPSRIRLAVPQSEGKVLSLLEARSRIFSREYRDGFVDLDVQAPESVVRRVKQFAR